MKISSKRLVTTAILSPIFALFLATPAFAADDCNFNAKIAQLRAIQTDGTQNYIDAIRAQLEVRKSILRSVIDCALEDTRDRQAKLQSVAPELKDAKASENVAKELEATADYYAEKRKIIDNLGIRGTQDLAKEINSWRTYRYYPAATQEDNLLLWSQNQGLFQKTASRFSQIKPVVVSLTLIDHEKIADTFTGAQKKFEEAEQKNDAAKKALLDEDGSAGVLIKSSLESLSSIYKNFLDLADEIKKIVP